MFVNLELSDTARVLYSCLLFILCVILFYPSTYLVPPTYPGQLRVSSVQPTSIDVAWDKLESSQQNGIITSYIIYVKSNIKLKTPVKTYQVNNASITIFSVTDLESKTLYSISISAVNDIGEEGPYSPSVNAITLPPGVFIHMCLSIYRIASDFRQTKLSRMYTIYLLIK